MCVNFLRARVCRFSGLVLHDWRGNTLRCCRAVSNRVKYRPLNRSIPLARVHSLLLKGGGKTIKNIATKSKSFSSVSSTHTSHALSVSSCPGPGRPDRRRRAVKTLPARRLHSRRVNRSRGVSHVCTPRSRRP